MYTTISFICVHLLEVVCLLVPIIACFAGSQCGEVREMLCGDSKEAQVVETAMHNIKLVNEDITNI